MSGVWLPLLCNCCCCLARAFHFCLHFRCGECWACAAACEAVHLHTQHRTHADIEAFTACSALQSYLSFQMRCCMRCECVLDRIEFSRHHRREAVFRRLHSHKQRSVWLFCVFIFHLSPASRNHETNDARKRTFALSLSLSARISHSLYSRGLVWQFRRRSLHTFTMYAVPAHFVDCLLFHLLFIARKYMCWSAVRIHREWIVVCTMRRWPARHTPEHNLLCFVNAYYLLLDSANYCIVVGGRLQATTAAVSIPLPPRNS